MICTVPYMKQLRTLVPRANVVLPGKWTDGHCVVIDCGQIVTEGSVNITHAMEPGRQQSTKHGNEAGAQQGLEEILAAVEVRHNHIFTVVDSGQGDVHLSVDPFVGILGQVFLESLQ